MRNDFFKNSVFKKGLILFFGAIIMNAFNYFYRVFMARMLAPELFGELIAIISLFLVLAVPANSLQTTVAKFTSVFEVQGKKKLKRLFNYFTKITTLTGIGIIVFSILFEKKVQIFFNFTYKNSVYFLGAILAVTFFGGIAKGILYGLERFIRLSLVNILEGFLRLSLGTILVIGGFKLTGALVGFLLASILSYFLAIYFVYDRIKNSQNSTPLKEMKEKREIWQYASYSFLALLLLSLLANIDKVLVKRYFSPLDAGIFSAFSTLGQAIFIGITSFGAIIFPTTASQEAKKENYFESLKTVSFVCFLIAIVGITISFFFPKELILIFFGKKYLKGAPFLGYYSLSIAILGFVFVLSYFFMALNRFKFLYFLALGSFLEIFLIIFRHNNFYQIISSFFISATFTLTLIMCLTFWERKQFLSKNV